MTKRERILALITAELASEGRITAYALRLKIENNIGWPAFRTAVDAGMKVANRAAELGKSFREVTLAELGVL